MLVTLVTLVMLVTGLAAFGGVSGATTGVPPSAPGSPGAAATCSPGNIWVNDATHIYEFGPDGSLLSTVPTGTFFDLAWNSTGTVLYGSAGNQLSVIDPTTGRATRLPPLTGLRPGVGLAGLSATAGAMLIGGAGNAVYTIDPATSVATLLATLPTSISVAGDFLPMGSGDTLIAATDRALRPDPATGGPRAVLVRLHADGTATEIGALPGVQPLGATSSGGQIYLADGTGRIIRVNGSLPSSQSTNPIGYSVVARSPGSGLLGAASTQEGVCAISDVFVSLVRNVAIAGGVMGLIAAGVLAVTALHRRQETLGPVRRHWSGGTWTKSAASRSSSRAASSCAAGRGGTGA